MKKYKVPVEWAMSGYLVVDAANPTEAIEKAREVADTCPLPEGEYIDGSFIINSQFICHLNVKPPFERSPAKISCNS